MPHLMLVRSCCLRLHGCSREGGIVEEGDQGASERSFNRDAFMARLAHMFVGRLIPSLFTATPLTATMTIFGVWVCF